MAKVKVPLKFSVNREVTGLTGRKGPRRNGRGQVFIYSMTIEYSISLAAPVLVSLCQAYTRLVPAAMYTMIIMNTTCA